MSTVIPALKANRHNIVDQLFEKIQTYKDEKHKIQKSISNMNTQTLI